jgi:hypothetical protein
MYLNEPIHDARNIRPARVRYACFILKRPQREIWVGKRLTVCFTRRAASSAAGTRTELVEASTAESASFKISEARPPPRRRLVPKLAWGYDAAQINRREIAPAPSGGIHIKQ